MNGIFWITDRKLRTWNGEHRFGLATHDGFTCMLHSCTIQEASEKCTEAAGNCGYPVVARLYFISFTICLTFTTMEMYGP